MNTVQCFDLDFSLHNLWYATKDYSIVKVLLSSVLNQDTQFRLLVK